MISSAPILFYFLNFALFWLFAFFWPSLTDSIKHPKTCRSKFIGLSIFQCQNRQKENILKQKSNFKERFNKGTRIDKIYQINAKVSELMINHFLS